MGGKPSKGTRKDRRLARNRKGQRPVKVIGVRRATR